MQVTAPDLRKKASGVSHDRWGCRIGSDDFSFLFALLCFFLYYLHLPFGITEPYFCGLNIADMHWDEVQWQAAQDPACRSVPCDPDPAAESTDSCLWNLL